MDVKELNDKLTEMLKNGVETLDFVIGLSHRHEDEDESDREEAIVFNIDMLIDGKYTDVGLWKFYKRGETLVDYFDSNDSQPDYVWLEYNIKLNAFRFKQWVKDVPVYSAWVMSDNTDVYLDKEGFGNERMLRWKLICLLSNTDKYILANNLSYNLDDEYTDPDIVNNWTKSRWEKNTFIFLDIEKEVPPYTWDNMYATYTDHSLLIGKKIDIEYTYYNGRFFLKILPTSEVMVDKLQKYCNHIWFLHREEVDDETLSESNFTLGSAIEDLLWEIVEFSKFRFKLR